MSEMDKLLLEILTKFEGCILYAYKCSAGIPTIGIGNTTYKDGSKVKMGDTITKEEAEDLCLYYCKKNINIDDLEHLNLSDKKKASIYSLIYNIGQANWNRSTIKKVILNNGSESDIRKNWLMWNKIKQDGKVIQSLGLSKRREMELKIFFS